MKISLEMIIAILGSIIGGGGLGAFLKARADAKKTDTESVLAQSESIINRWKELEAQASYHSNDLEKKTEALTARVDALTKEVAKLKSEMDNIRSEYRVLEVDYVVLSRYATTLEEIVKKLDPEYVLPERPITRHSINNEKI